MKFTASLNINRDQLNNLIHFVSYRIIARVGNDVIVSLEGEAESITRVLQEFASPIQQKTFAAKAAIEDLFSEVEKVSLENCGVIKSVLVPLELEGAYVTSHFTLFENSRDHQGIIVNCSTLD